MSGPLVSVCLPNLNTLPYLRERIETIQAQTYTHWELIVSDNYSEDGAWEFFQQVAATDARILIEQAPREGLYPNWNNCLRRARGEYVYIATSDDTMAPDCLEKLVAALETYRDCDLAHCPLVIIDQDGRRLAEPRWPDCTTFAHGLGALAHQPHIRRAPYDGLIHLAGEHVILSITQLLIRRSLFSRTGPFGSRWGSASDFNWEMKAGLVANMIHVPDTWASWRMHPTQATAAVDVYKPEKNLKSEEMIQDAFDSCAHLLAPEVVEGLRSHWLTFSKEMNAYHAALRHHRSVPKRRRYQLGQLLGGTNATRSEMLGRFIGKPKWPDIAPHKIRMWLESISTNPVIEPVGPSSTSSAKG